MPRHTGWHGRYQTHGRIGLALDVAVAFSGFLGYRNGNE